MKVPFPYRIEKKHNFLLHLKERNNFFDRHWGPERVRYYDNGVALERDDSGFSPEEKANNNYIVDDFLAWEKWYNAGSNVLYFPDNLTGSIKTIDLASISFKELKLPYTNFFLDLKNLSIRLSRDNHSLVEGVYIHSEIDDDYDLALHLDFAGDFQNEYLKNVDKIYENFSGRNSAAFWKYSLFFIEGHGIITIDEAVKDSRVVYQATYFPDVVSEVNDNHLDLLNYHLDFVGKTVKPVIKFLTNSHLPN